MRRSVTFAILCAGLSLAATGSSLGRDAVRPPLGLQLYCLQNMAECRSSGSSAVQTSDDLVAVLREVNRRVNSSIAPRADGLTDQWQAGAASGDCEDYVLTKRQMLIRHGVPDGALRIAYTKTRSGEGHAVLIVRTEAGDLVLDNLVAEVKLLSATGYQVHRISSPNLLSWTSY